ncbi:hypothetical protein Neosp_014703 [[Neocosmospora] mangrovei]
MSENDESQRLRGAAIQRTTFEEYLRYCHEHLFKSLQASDDLLLTKSSESTTSVDAKYYPLKLRPWEDFLGSQRTHYNIIREVLNGTRLLPSLSYVEETSETADGPNVASEADLNLFERLALEEPAQKVYKVFGPRCQSHPMTQGLECTNIRFTNQLPTLQEPDGNEESGRISQTTQKQPRLGFPDRWCGRRIAGEQSGPRNGRGQDHIAFPIEYKAAHKIGVQDFEAALQKEDLFDQVLSNVVGHKLSTGHDRDNGRRDEKVAKALAQIFHYMVCCRSTFGYLTGGHSLIFLRIDEDAQVLYHHMVQPDKNFEGKATDLFFTGVAQLSAFCLRSFLEPRKTKEWLVREQARLQTWPNPYPEMREPTAEVPSSSPKAPSTASYIASSPSPKNDASQSPPVRLTRSSCKDIELVEEWSGPGDTDSDEDHHSDDAGIQPSIPEAASGSKKRKKGSSDSEYSASADGSSFELDGQQYCTQACLLGLKRQGPLDEKCPNVALHRSLEGGSRHHIDIRKFIQLLNAQIGEPCYRYRYCQPVDGKYGARGQLFKLSLRKYGYTFVGKGTFAGALPSIEHESEVYSRLDSLQGNVVPGTECLRAFMPRNNESH